MSEQSLVHRPIHVLLVATLVFLSWTCLPSVAAPLGGLTSPVNLGINATCSSSGDNGNVRFVSGFMEVCAYYSGNGSWIEVNETTLQTRVLEAENQTSALQEVINETLAAYALQIAETALNKSDYAEQVAYNAKECAYQTRNELNVTKEICLEANDTSIESIRRVLLVEEAVNASGNCSCQAVSLLNEVKEITTNGSCTILEPRIADLENQTTNLLNTVTNVLEIQRKIACNLKGLYDNDFDFCVCFNDSVRGYWDADTNCRNCSYGFQGPNCDCPSLDPCNVRARYWRIEQVGLLNATAPRSAQIELIDEFGSSIYIRTSMLTSNFGTDICSIIPYGYSNNLEGRGWVWSNGNYLTVDFGRPRTIRKFRVYASSCSQPAGAIWRMMYSSDGSTWETQEVEGGGDMNYLIHLGTCGWYEFQFPLATGPVSNVVYALEGLQVQLNWTLSNNPEYFYTRVDVSMGGILISSNVTEYAVHTWTTQNLTLWNEYNISLTAVNENHESCSPVDITIPNIPILGQKRCPFDQFLVGVDPITLEIQCKQMWIYDTVENNVVEALGGHTNSPISVQCPSGYSVTGGGFNDIDQTLLGNLTDDFMSRPLNNGWVVGYNHDTDTFNVRALCGRSNSYPDIAASPTTVCSGTNIVGGISNTQDVRSVTCANPFNRYNALDCQRSFNTQGGKSIPSYSFCPVSSPPYIVVGGGFEDIDQEGTGTKLDDFTSAFVTNGTGWFVTFDDEVDNFTSHAVCCRLNVTLTPLSNSNSCPFGQLPCGIDRNATGYFLVCSNPIWENEMNCTYTRMQGGQDPLPMTLQCPIDRTLLGGGVWDIDQFGSGSANDNLTAWPLYTNSWFQQFDDEAGQMDTVGACCNAISPHQVTWAA